MKPLLAYALAGTVLLSAAFGAQAATDDPAPYGNYLTSSEVPQSRPGSFDVYIDPPTGFAFVHTPTGWTFTRKVPDDSLVLAELRARYHAELLASAAQQ
ncbi:hypothetical protein [Azoarcus sp. DN11]|uniref:hypothetical protein n=1 Tax=Azoarcus sp. DN11 TaxID=356837 RepID=UPI000EB111A3|nr:hypothetical protein [Azoarcus sp. DN11]AYH44002.1 hypothetical protein CDA09_11505 [Azoarcus sp. DN11]